MVAIYRATQAPIRAIEIKPIYWLSTHYAAFALVNWGADTHPDTRMFGQDRTELRQMFYNVWQKLQQNQPLTALEGIIASIIEAHPEYHAVLQDPDNQDKDYTLEQGQTNPFLHMAMHIAIREQLSTGRPAGIVEAHLELVSRHGPHDAEHVMLECLGETLWQAQRSNQPPDEVGYLLCVQKKAGIG